MLKRLVFLGLLLFALFIPTKASAASAFLSSYKVHYDVELSGETLVTENITFTNLTDNYYASLFTLSIAASSVSDVEAFDSSGQLSFKVEPKLDTLMKQNIAVSFPQQISGKGKEYTWTLKFKTKDFVSLQGKIWQLSVPKIVESPDLTKYDLTVSVPVSFGDPTVIIPEPASQNEANEKLNLIFDKSQLTQNGILATFGSKQFFGFDLTYNLSNPGILPIISEISLPSDTSYQKIAIDNISPKPENIVTDPDGNSIAAFKLEKFAKQVVHVSGSATVFINPWRKDQPITNDDVLNLTSPQKYWDKDSSVIKSKLNEIFAKTNPVTNREKAKIIYNYVTSVLKFDEARLKLGNYARIGGLTALSNPDEALGNEFVDLFITLCRGANIPTRSLVGFAYTQNQIIRPNSFSKGLHAWAEYFDPNTGWKMVDPTWESTAGGVDYFNDFDLNHVIIATRGYSSLTPSVPEVAEFKFREVESSDSADLYAKFDLPSKIYGAIPSKGKITIINKGKSSFGSSKIVLSLNRIKAIFDKFKIEQETAFTTPTIPPGGFLEYNFDIRSDSVFSGFKDKIEVQIGTKKFEQEIIVEPFFNAQFFPGLVALSTLLMLAAYLTAVFLHIKKRRSTKPKK